MSDIEKDGFKQALETFTEYLTRFDVLLDRYIERNEEMIKLIELISDMNDRLKYLEQKYKEIIC